MNGDPRILYATMMKTRIDIFSMLSFYSWRVQLIAIRYSLVRRQFRNGPGKKEETKLLDYPT